MSVFLLNFACLSSISPNFIFLGKITFQSYTPSQRANKLVIVTIFRLRILAWISKYPLFANIATILKLPLIDDARIHGCQWRAAFLCTTLLPFRKYLYLIMPVFTVAIDAPHFFEHIIIPLWPTFVSTLLASICFFARYSNLSIILFVPK